MSTEISNQTLHAYSGLVSQPKLSRPRAVLWDWDNTLVDGWPAIAAGLNAAFAQFGMPQWTLADVKGRVRRSLRDSFPDMFGTNWERARDTFYAEVRERHLAVLKPMPGAIEAIAAASMISPQGVVSNKQGTLLRAEVEKLGWGTFFRSLVGSGDASEDKPAPAAMLPDIAAKPRLFTAGI